MSNVLDMPLGLLQQTIVGGEGSACANHYCPAHYRCQEVLVQGSTCQFISLLTNPRPPWSPSRISKVHGFSTFKRPYCWLEQSTALRRNTFLLSKLRSTSMTGPMAPLKPVQTFQDVWVLWDAGAQVTQILSSQLRDDIKEETELSNLVDPEMPHTFPFVGSLVLTR